MFRLQKGVRQYMVETYSDLHFTAPNIYDQKVKASMGTVHNSRGVPGMLEYFNINLYSSTLLYDRLLSPLAKNTILIYCTSNTNLLIEGKYKKNPIMRLINSYFIVISG